MALLFFLREISASFWGNWLQNSLCFHDRSGFLFVPKLYYVHNKGFFFEETLEFEKKKNTLKELKNQLHFRLKSWVNTSPVTCLPPLKEVQWEMRISIYSWERKVNTHRFVLSLWSWRTNQFVFCSKGKQ